MSLGFRIRKDVTTNKFFGEQETNRRLFSIGALGMCAFQQVSDHALECNLRIVRAAVERFNAVCLKPCLDLCDSRSVSEYYFEVP